MARRDNNAALRFRMYQCDDRDEDACLNPVAREDTVAGMTQRVKDVLIGVREWQAGASKPRAWCRSSASATCP